MVFVACRASVVSEKCPILAQLRSPDRLRTRPMMEVDRTYVGHRETDAFDPQRTWRPDYAITSSA